VTSILGAVRRHAAAHLVCRALIHEPQLLMLDEPFWRSRCVHREELWCVIRDLHAVRKVTVCLVTL